MPRYGDPISFTVTLRPDVSRNGFLRDCYDTWIDDISYYREHPEVECDPGYLKTCSFEEFVAEIAESRAGEMVDMGRTEGGFKIEVRRNG